MKLEEKSREELIEQVRRLQDRINAHVGAERGAEEVLLQRLQTARKAKRLANRRADTAEAAMRAMLDAFGQMRDVAAAFEEETKK